MRRTKNASSAWIMAWGIDQSGERDHEGGFLSCSGNSEVVLVNSFAGAGAGAGAVGIAAFCECSACNSSSWDGSYDYYSLRPHVGSVPVESSRVLGL